jgi:hypothetical protein
MKSVKDFFGEEKRRANAGPTKDAIEDARKKLAQQFNRPSRVSANPSGYTITNLPGGNIPDEQKFANLERLAKQRQSKSAAAASDVSPEARTTAANTAARARETRPGQRRPLGDTTRGGPVKVTQLKPTKPAPAPKPEVVKQSAVSRKAAVYRKKVAQQADKVLRSLQRGQDTSSRMGRGYSKSLARTGDAIISGIGAERKAETAAGKAEFKKLRYGKGQSGPATNLRTPAQTRTYQTGVKKGYFDPKTGRVSETGLQRHVNMRAVGGENFGKMQGRDPRQALSKVSNITSRAAAGDRAARSEVRRSYKAITRKYSPETGSRSARQGGSPGFRSFQQQTRNVDTPRLKSQRMSMPLPGTQQRPVSSPAAQATKEKLRQKLDLKLQSKPQKGGALSTPTTTDIVKGTKGGQLSTGVKGGKLSGTTIEPVKVSDVTKPSTTRPAQLPAGTTKTTKTTTKPGRAPSTYRGTGAGRVEVSSAPKTPTPTQLLTPGQPTQQAVGTKPKEVKIPRPTKTPDLNRRKTYQDFVKQTGTTSTRKGSWSYSPSTTKAQTQSQAVQNVKQTLKQTNPTRYARQLQKRATNIAKIRSVKNTSGGMLGGAFAGFDAMQTYNQARSQGQSKEYATKKAIATGAGGWAGAELGAKMGAKIGSKLPGKLGLIGAGVGAIGGGLVGGTLGTQGAKAFVGASAKDKEAMKKMNRAVQRGTSADQAQFKSGNKAIIRDTSGKERVGYKAYKDGKVVYKHAADPAALRMTSSNPLERLGRSVAANKDLGPVSDWMKSRYAASDEAARKKKITTVKTAGSK